MDMYYRAYVDADGYEYGQRIDQPSAETEPLKREDKRKHLDREWSRVTSETINTSARMPKELYWRMIRYADQRGLTITDCIIIGVDGLLRRAGEGAD